MKDLTTNLETSLHKAANEFIGALQGALEALQAKITEAHAEFALASAIRAEGAAKDIGTLVQGFVNGAGAANVNLPFAPDLGLDGAELAGQGDYERPHAKLPNVEDSIKWVPAK